MKPLKVIDHEPWQLEANYWQTKYQKLVARIETMTTMRAEPLDRPYADDESYREYVSVAMGRELGALLLNTPMAFKQERTEDRRAGQVILRVSTRILMNNEEEDT